MITYYVKSGEIIVSLKIMSCELLIFLNCIHKIEYYSVMHKLLYKLFIQFTD